MIFSQLALSFVLTVGSAMAAFATPSQRKLSKKNAALTLVRTCTPINASNNAFHATIDCDLFGDGDPELCMFSEYTIRDIVTDCDDDEVLAGICVPVADGWKRIHQGK